MWEHMAGSPRLSCCLPNRAFLPAELFAADLNKLDGWRCVRENSVGEDAFKEYSTEEDTDEEDD